MCVEYPIVSTCMLYYVCDRRVDSNGLASQAKQPSEARISKSTSFHKMVVLGSFVFLIMNASLCREDTCLVTLLGMFMTSSKVECICWHPWRGKVLFTSRCRRQNFRPSLLHLVDRLYTVIHCCKRLGQKFCLLQRWVNSTLQGCCKVWKSGRSHNTGCG